MTTINGARYPFNNGDYSRPYSLRPALRSVRISGRPRPFSDRVKSRRPIGTDHCDIYYRGRENSVEKVFSKKKIIKILVYFVNQEFVPDVRSMIYKKPLTKKVIPPLSLSK